MMKKIVMFSLGIVLITGIGYADPPEEKEKFQPVKCPETTMQRECLTCHVTGKMPGAKGRFPVKEALPDAWRVYPVNSMKVIDGVGRFFFTDVNSQEIKEFFDYLDRHEIKKAIIEIHSPGGSLFDAQRIVSLIQSWQASGGTVETRLYGAAFSAGFYIFVSGDNRLVSPNSDLMWHELKSFEGYGFKITTPSDKEEEARILRHLQNIRNAYLATRGKLNKAEMDEKVAKKEFWMSGKEAVEFGFADGFIK